MNGRELEPFGRRLNWPWILGSELLGGVLIVIAFWLEGNYQWQGVSIATLVAVGSIMLLTGVGFLLERRFLREVSRAASESVSAAVDARVEAASRQIGLRLDQLEELMEERQQERRTEHDETIAALGEPSFESVATAMTTANRIGAIRNGHVTVQGSVDPDELGLTFSWGRDLGDGRFGLVGGDGLRIKAELFADIFDRRGGGRPVIEVQWQPDDTADAVGMRIREQLEHRGRWTSEGTLRWGVALANLQRALDLAVRSRRRDQGALWLKGALSEYVDDLWMITDAGIECPSRDYIFFGDDFPERPMRPQRPDEATWSPEAPPWADPVVWRRLVDRGRLRFPIRRGPLGTMPTWMPLTKTPKQLREET